MNDLSDYRQDFHRLVSHPDAGIDLTRAALSIAAAFQSSIDMEDCQRQLDRLAEAARFRVRTTDNIGKVATDLCSFLHRQQGFSGNSQAYYDPANSYLDKVLGNRCGIPITLALVYLAVATELELEMYGIGFPGHFLLKLVREKNIIIDPFNGRQLSHQECAQMLVRAGLPANQLGHYLQPATNREILARILNNLKAIFYQQNSFAESLRCIEWRLILDPLNSQDLLERGLMLEHAGNIRKAIEAYENFLEIAPDGEVSHEVRQKLGQLINRYRKLH